MSTITIKVCEECGAQSASADGWLVMSSIEIRSAKTGEEVLHNDEPVDLCSRGCALRYISRCLGTTTNGQSTVCRPRLENPDQPIRVFI